MSHSVKITLIADQEVEIKGRRVNVHGIRSIIVDGKGVITDAYLESGAPGLCAGWLSMMAPQPAIIYKEFYNKDRGLPEPEWGYPVSIHYVLQCPTCGSVDMYYSGSPDNPEETTHDSVRCGHCGHITDWYEAFKQRNNHPTDVPRGVARENPHCQTGQGRYT